MGSRKIAFSVLFSLIAIFELINIYYNNDLRIISKPLIMITLGAYYYYFCKNFNAFFFTALFMALLGDIFLMWEGNIFFVLGLSFFLIMQILYIVVFFKDKGALSPGHWVIMTFLLVLGILLLNYLLPKVNKPLMLPVIIYCFTIIGMVSAALIRDRKNKNYTLILTGAIVFLISDTLLSINMFHHSLLYGGILVMATYMAAQFLIVEGKIRE
ncbi:MAG TPA: lysoplasmalogenase [Saprospiraceae bacterium]|nr:lysoplasmalogenase [Saprospiraceae bacterium]